MKSSINLILLSLFIFTSCSTNEQVHEEEIIDYDAVNETEILDYLSSKNLSAQKTNSGLYYIIENEGSGEFPNSDSNVTVKYKIFLIDGTNVGENLDNSGDVFNLRDSLIKGFIESILLLKEGGNGIFILPSRLAYGEFPPPSIIPIWSVLICEINLEKIE